MKILDFIHNTKAQAALAFTIIIGGGLLLKFGHMSDTINNRLFDLMFLTATFYFGSSKSGASKDEAIAKLSANQQQPIVGNSEKTSVTVSQ